MYYRLYVGANNKTGSVEYKKARAVVSSFVDGFTAYKSVGYWQGKPENSYIIELANVKSGVVTSISKELKRVLKQQAVGIVKLNSNMKFI